MHRTASPWAAAVWLLAAGWGVSPAWGQDFPPITEAERALTRVPYQPEAAAVVLFEKADLRFRDYPSEASSFLDVAVRLKILTEEGKELGEIEVPHSRNFRLKKLEARTVLPDGRVVPLADDAVFREERSRLLRRFVTKAALPAVEVGAILDYRYTMAWDTFYYLEPWFFHRSIPVLHSEIVYHKPDNLGVLPWGVETGSAKFQLSSQQEPRGALIRVAMDNLTAIPEEPNALPAADLASRFMMVPKTLVLSGTNVPLLDSWRSVCEVFQDQMYDKALSKDRQVRRRAAELVAGRIEGDRAKAAALFAFVRDEILTERSAWVGIEDDVTVDRVLAAGRGTEVEKALLLEAMLAAVKLQPTLVWAADREAGSVDLEVANPWWFDRVLVALDLGGEQLFLDPSERRLGFGRLSPGNVGAAALLFPGKGRKTPQTITLPEPGFEANRRHAELTLALDEEGRVSGSGSLELAGLHAYPRLRWKEDAAATAESWRDWLAAAFEEYEVEGVEVEESVDDSTVAVRWKLAQRPDAVLGDEASLKPSRPLGPVRQVFTLPPERRLTPVQLAFADRDEVELTLSWPPGWEVEVIPEAVDAKGAAGSFTAHAEVDPEARRLTYVRRFDITSRQFVGREAYALLRDLYAQAEKHDAEDVGLVRR